jgi:hypothetical protein
MTCGEAVRLIAAAVEGGLAPRPLDGVVAHIEWCATCRVETETQMLVKRVLGATPHLPLPAGVAQRIAVRIDAEAERRAAAVDWRAWTVRLLPAAACLVLIAAIVHQIARRSVSSEVSAAIAAWGRDEIRSLETPRIGSDNHQLLGVLLIDAHSTSSQEDGH